MECDLCDGMMEWPRRCVGCHLEVCDNCLSSRMDKNVCSECVGDVLADDEEEEDVLYRYAVEPAHDAATLNRYLVEHRDRGEAILDLHRELTREPTN